MEEQYKDVLIEKIVKDFETGEYSLHEIAKKYSFPSLKILSNVLKRYYQRERKITLDKIDLFSYDEKYSIFHEYKDLHHSLKQLSLKYMTTTTVIRNTVEEFESLEQIRTERKQNRIEVVDIDINTIIEELKKGKTYSFIINKYGVSYEKLKELLYQNEEGREIIKKRKEKHKRNVIIPMDELVDGLKNGTLKKIEERYGVSESTLRNKLKKEYGDHYVYILETDRSKKIENLNKYGKAYEQGYTYDEMAELFSVLPDEARQNVLKYYRRNNMSKPRVLTEAQLIKYLKHNNSIEQLIEECRMQNVILPQQLLDKYIQGKDEVDIHKIKTLVHEELSKLKKEGKEPNFINPFKLANSLKQHGYGTSYQACAILYSLIEENNLSIEILKQIENSELTEAVLTLLNQNNINKIQFLQMLNNNKIAYIVYKEENNLIIDEKENDENRS